MPYYDYKKDFPVAEHTEIEIATLIKRMFKATILEIGETSAYDIKARINDRIYTFEVKEDFTCEKTGNVGVEFSCRGEPSGIDVSKADFYIYKIHTKEHGIKFFIMWTKILRKMILNHWYFRIVNGGDPGSDSMNYLFRYDTFIRKANDITPKS